MKVSHPHPTLTAAKPPSLHRVCACTRAPACCLAQVVSLACIMHGSRAVCGAVQLVHAARYGTKCRNFTQHNPPIGPPAARAASAPRRDAIDGGDIEGGEAGWGDADPDERSALLALEEAFQGTRAHMPGQSAPPSRASAQAVRAACVASCPIHRVLLPYLRHRGAAPQPTRAARASAPRT